MSDTQTLEDTIRSIAVENNESFLIADLQHSPEQNLLKVQFQGSTQAHEFSQVSQEEFQQLQERIDARAVPSIAPDPQTTPSKFSQQLQDALADSQLDPTAPISLTMGDQQIVEGSLNDPATDFTKLTPSRINLVEALIEDSAGGLNPTSPTLSSAIERGGVTLEVNEQTVLQVSGGVVQVNELYSEERQELKETQQAIDQLADTLMDKRGAEIEQVISGLGLGEIENWQDDERRVAMTAMLEWVQTEATTDPDMIAFDQQYPNKIAILDKRLLDRVEDPSVSLAPTQSPAEVGLEALADAGVSSEAQQWVAENIIVDSSVQIQAYYLMNGDQYSTGQEWTREPHLMNQAQSDYYLKTAGDRGLDYERYETTIAVEPENVQSWLDRGFAIALTSTTADLGANEAAPLDSSDPTVRDTVNNYSEPAADPSASVSFSPEESSAIASIRYDRESEKLFVQFQSGDKEYPQYNVPESKFEEFSQAESKGQFFHTQIQGQYPPTPEQEFRDNLKTTLEAAGIDTNEPVRITAGREVAFKGAIDDPDVNKLSPSRIAILNAALDAAADGSDSIESDDKQAKKGVLKIEVGDQTVLRLESGSIKINELQPIREQQQEAESRDLAESLDGLGDRLLARHGDSLQQIYQERGLEAADYEDAESFVDLTHATRDWMQQESVKGDPDLMQFREQFPGTDWLVASKLLEQQFDPDYEPDREPTETPEATLNLLDRLGEAVDEVASERKPEVETALDNSSGTSVEASEVLAKASVAVVDRPQAEPIAGNDADAPAPTPPEPSAPAQQTAATAPMQSENLTVPAAAIGLRELYQSIPEPAKQWASGALDKLREASGLVPDDLSKHGLEMTQNAIATAKQLPEDLRKRELASSVVNLAKTFGTEQEEDGRKIQKVETNKYTIRSTDNQQYSVTTAKDEPIASFTQTKSGAKFNALSGDAIAQGEIIQAGRQVSVDGAKEAASTIADKLWNLTPKSIKDAAQGFKQGFDQAQMVGRLNKKLDEAIGKGENAIKGKHYRLEQHEDGSRTLTANGADKPTLTIAADGKVDGTLSPADFDRLNGKSAQKSGQKSRAKQEMEQ